jgi:hypothetical protein
MSLATLGDRVGVDLWHFETKDGRNIRRAVDYLLPYSAGEKKWDHQQLGGWSAGGFTSILRRAAVKYPDERYSAALAKVAAGSSANWRDLLR